MFNPLHQFKGIVRWHLSGPILKRLLRQDHNGRLSQVGGWYVPDSILNQDSICYCGGVGENIEFEQALISQYHSHVFAFDPTPRAGAYVQRLQPNPQRFTFLPWGLWSQDTTMKFFAPRNQAHVSHSIVEVPQSDQYFKAPCRRLSSIMRELGHDHIDLLKMNIEGAEYEVLKGMLEDNIRPSIICVAFEGPHAFADTLRWTHKLRDYGYQFARFYNWVGTFVASNSAVGTG